MRDKTSDPLDLTVELNFDALPDRGDPFPYAAPFCFVDDERDGIAGNEERVVCGDLNMRIDQDGTWYYEGSPITRKEMVCLFASTLTRDSEGAYWLVTPTEMGRIEVEDVPFQAVEMFVCSGGREQTLSFRTNCDEVVTVDENHPIRVVTDPETGEPSPYIMVRDGLEARLTRSVYYDLVARGVEEKINNDTIYGVWSRNQFFPLGKVTDDT